MINIHFSEIMLKGRNRKHFEDILVRSIRSSLIRLGKFHIVKDNGRILVSGDDKSLALKALMNVFGIDLLFVSVSTDRNIDAIQAAVLSERCRFLGKSIKVSTKRADKTFHLSSQQVNESVGKALVDIGCRVDLTNPDVTIFIEILPDKALISLEKYRGFGGLPVGSSGPVLSLLSGGIDSPVSSWLMMKRGCDVDFIHLHALPSNSDAKNSKILDTVRLLKAYSPNKMRIFMMPYDEFYKKTLSTNPKNELVVFRRFLLKLANKIADKYGHKGLVTGDSIGQVASQTLDNLFTTNEASFRPVFRPLITYNKQEIVDLSIKIGTYDISIEKYKDCCSLVANKNPNTASKLEAVKQIEDQLGIDEIIEKTLAKCEVIEI